MNIENKIKNYLEEFDAMDLWKRRIEKGIYKKPKRKKKDSEEYSKDRYDKYQAIDKDDYNKNIDEVYEPGQDVGPKEIEKLSDIKVGDKIQATDFWRKPNKTLTGKILQIGSDVGRDLVLIEFDEDVDGHDGDAGQMRKRGKKGHCWNIWLKEFKRYGIRKI